MELLHEQLVQLGNLWYIIEPLCVFMNLTLRYDLKTFISDSCSFLSNTYKRLCMEHDITWAAKCKNLKFSISFYILVHMTCFYWTVPAWTVPFLLFQLDNWRSHFCTEEPF